ncbi:MAG: phosphate/phosphite/phosphonate ABC transporter substrate-binding protein [Magnetococcales bacterium]|nr:phosphate/phosphite/phosphonate ABC transporter substrate-binding protein [Magnetococcales bacterium]
MNHSRIPIFFIMIVCFAGLFWFKAEAAPEKDPRVLVYATISKDPAASYPPLKQMVDYAAARLGGVGIEKGEVLLAKDEYQLAQYLREKKADWVSGSYYIAIMLKQTTGVEWLLRRWKDGIPEYHTVFITKHDSAIQSLDALQGGKIAFESPVSSSGFIVPMIILLEKKWEMELIPSFRHPAPAHKTAYVFSKSALNTASWVSSGAVDVGAISNADWEQKNTIPATVKGKLRLIGQSDPYPRMIEMVRPDLPPALKQQLKELLKHAHEQPEGKAVLKEFSNTNRFDDLPADTLKKMEGANTTISLIKPYKQP